MAKIDFRFAELLCSRLCHDLITPIGAINTGFELLEEGTSNDQQDIENLIKQSAAVSASRLSLYRVAFGSSGRGETFGVARQLAEKYFMNNELEIHWKPPFDENACFKGWSRIILNILVWLGECAPRGGDIWVTVPSEENKTLVIKLEADLICVQDEAVEALKGEVSLEDLTPRTAQSCLLFLLISAGKNKIEILRETPKNIILKVFPQ